MKRNIFLGALVLSVGLSGQSFGAGLLDRILGHGGRGCCDTAPSCGCEAAPSCGCEAAPSCGCEAAPSCGCEAAPSCGCEAAPSCGCEAAPSCGCGCGGGLLGKLKKCGGNCCPLLKLNLPKISGCGCGCSAAPSCGCAGESQIDCDSPSEAPAANNGDPGEAPDASDAAPMPPAPLVDPSAFLPSKRRVIGTSAVSP